MTESSLTRSRGDDNALIALTREQRDALTRLIANAILDTGANRWAALYNAILSKLTKEAAYG